MLRDLKIYQLKILPDMYDNDSIYRQNCREKSDVFSLKKHSFTKKSLPKGEMDIVVELFVLRL